VPAVSSLVWFESNTSTECQMLHRIAAVKSVRWLSTVASYCNLCACDRSYPCSNLKYQGPGCGRGFSNQHPGHETFAYSKAPRLPHGTEGRTTLQWGPTGLSTTSSGHATEEKTQSHLFPRAPLVSGSSNGRVRSLDSLQHRQAPVDESGRLWLTPTKSMYHAGARCELLQGTQ
jgi:hypothetical protein